MFPLYILSAHMAGDFLLQNRWHSDRKFTVPKERRRHVFWYSVCFIPIAIYYSENWWKALLFMLGLYFIHYLTDSRRFLSTPGDYFGFGVRHEFAGKTAKEAEWNRALHDHREIDHELWPPANPWLSMPLMIDQTLHLLQLTLLSALLLQT